MKIRNWPTVKKNNDQLLFLNELFERGEKDKANKVNAEQASKMMVTTTTTKDGFKRFNRLEHLTSSQISSWLVIVQQMDHQRH